MMFHRAKKSSAKVIDGNLIISMPDAVDPVVWRMALGEARTAALEVKQKQDHYVLQLKNAKGETNDIAPFISKDKATDALMAVSKAMQSAQGQIQTPSTGAVHAAAPEKITAGWKWVIPLSLIILAVFIFSRSGDILPVDNTQDNTTAASSTVNPQETGVSLPADSVLNGM